MPITHVYDQANPDVNLLEMGNFSDDFRGQVAVTDACYTFLGVIELCVSINASSIDISASVNIPFLGKKSLGSCSLNPSHPSCSLGINIAVADVSVGFDYDFSTHALTVTGKACILSKCVQGSHTFKF